ncbi:MFS transporter [Promicromonospora thailandica]|uniref:Arabinose efflux permease, MFS family n=1 Tax=Promicromonospora thailandica TaxID=765201 RepID=A0A9X2G4B0_9MICO|nr:MFS transporter [Promicromonospora thailandica]MCP2266830.1 putative arabinose efflux permease, MFS family [Promicromonospora thailandica]
MPPSRPGDTAAVVPAGRRTWWPVAAAMLAVAWGGNEFTPLLVMYREQGDMGPVTVDALLAVYVLGLVPALLLGGPLSDRFGRRPLLLPAAPVSALGSLVLALDPSSPVVLSIGRLLCGVALGLAMAVGSTWVTELSAATGDRAAGPRRGSLSLTTGFLAGAGVAAMLAQFAPWPTLLSYVLHAAGTLVAGVILLRVPETRPALPRDARAPLADDLRITAVRHPRFLRVVVPLAPWVFGCGGCAFAVLPSLLSDHVGGLPIAFAGMMAILALGCGIGIQVVARRIDTPASARASMVALVIVAAGMALAAWASGTLSLPVGIAAAVVLGLGYGLSLVAGLSEVARIAAPRQLAGLTAVFYSLTYVGFFVPMVLAWLADTWTYLEMFGFGTVAVLLCLTVVALSSRTAGPAGLRR